MKQLTTITSLTAVSTAIVLALSATPAAAQQCTNGAFANSTQCGTGAEASSDNTTAVGANATAGLSGSTAIGAESSATIDSTAVGDNASAGTFSVAVGSDAEAADGSVALGNGASALQENSVALGSGSVTVDPNTVSVGSNDIQRRITNVDDGIFSNDAVNFGQLEVVQDQVTAQNGQISALQFSNAQQDVAIAETQIAIGGLVEVNAQQDAAIQENTEGVTKLFAAVDNHSYLIADNSDAIAQNVLDIAANTASIDTNSAAIAANSAMLDDHDQRLMALEDLTYDLGNTLSRFDKEIDGSTAVAIAMSGNAFLPDRKVNVTSNLGFYNGAIAGSLQLGVLVSENVAVNAGIATGFNKGGKTGGRVGVSFGW